MKWLEWTWDQPAWRAPDPRPPAVHTERLTIRRYEPGDGPKLFEAIDSDRQSILPWMIWASTDHRRVEDSIHYVETHVRGTARPDCTNFPLGIFERATGRLVGGTGLHELHSRLRQTEIGYWIRGSAQRQGLATEAVGALVGSALRPIEAGGWGLRRVYCYVATQNLGSKRVCERLGLRLEGKFRRERYLGYPRDNPLGWTDTLLYAVLEDEWDHAAVRAKDGIGWDGGLV